MRVAVIGAGFGQRVMAPAYARQGCTVEVVAARDRAAIERVCRAGVDLVSVHSPPFLHREHVLTALDHGRPVLCDKPFGRDAAEARAMRDRAQAAGLANFLNFEFRHQPARLALKRCLDEGAIGTLEHVGVTFFSRGWRALPHRWLFEAEKGGGWLGAWGSHAIDMLRWLHGSEVATAGGLRRIDATFHPDDTGAPRAATAEDAFTAWLALRSGGTGAIDTAVAGSVNRPAATLALGSEGALELVDDARLTLSRPGQPDERVDTGDLGPDMFATMLDASLAQVALALAGKPASVSTFDDGLAVATTLDGLKRDMAWASPAPGD